MLDWADLAYLIAGVVLAAAGGEAFVKATLGVAQRLRIPIGVAGVTLAAFATSSPELSVALNAAAVGQPAIALGDSLGSNVANICLVLGIALTISGIQVPPATIRRDFGVAVALPLLLAILMVDGSLDRWDGAILIAVFVGWLVVVTIDALRHRRQSEPSTGGDSSVKLAILLTVGVIALIVAGRLVVTGAKGVAVSLGLPPFIIGAVVVAIGTSTPELATTILSKLRGHDEIGLGNVLGSNIFNGLWIVGILALVSPVVVHLSDIWVVLGFGLVSIIWCYPFGNGYLGRLRGVTLIAMYAIYTVVIITTGMA